MVEAKKAAKAMAAWDGYLEWRGLIGKFRWWPWLSDPDGAGALDIRGPFSTCCSATPKKKINFFFSFVALWRVQRGLGLGG